MNALFLEYGLGAWKAVLTALLLPPVPLLLIALWGGRMLWGRRGVGWFVMTLALAGLWLSACAGMGQALGAVMQERPRALPLAQLEALKRDGQARKTIAIVVLGGGREVFAPEYGVSSLSAGSLERLRYGIWLSRETGLPLAFSGGVGWGQADGLSEAQIAGRIAANEFGRPLRWLEELSRDTRENAARTTALLGNAGITDIVLVTHGWHMPRALRAFEEAGQGRFKLTPAPIGLTPQIDRQALMWLPSAEGFAQVRNVLREAVGWAMGS